MLLKILLLTQFTIFVFCQIIVGPSFKECDNKFKCNLITDKYKKKECYINCNKIKKDNKCLRKKDKNGVYEIKFDNGVKCGCNTDCMDDGCQNNICCKISGRGTNNINKCCSKKGHHASYESGIQYICD